MRFQSLIRDSIICVFAVTCLLAAGCDVPLRSPTAPGPLPSPEQRSDQGSPTAGLLQVRTIEVIVTASYPARVNVRVKGDLPDTCTSVERVSQSRNGNTIEVSITTVREAESCAEVLRPIEQSVLLNGPFSEGSYTIRVNGVERRFSI